MFKLKEEAGTGTSLEAVVEVGAEMIATANASVGSLVAYQGGERP